MIIDISKFDFTPIAFRERLPYLYQHLIDMGKKPPIVADRRRILAGSSQGREIAAKLPSGHVVLDCSAIEAVTPSFVRNLLCVRPDVTAIGLSNENREAWEMGRKAAQKFCS